MKKRTIILISSILTIIAIIVAIAVFTASKAKSAKLIIQIAPTDAIVTIDGKEYQNGTYNFYPNEGVEVKISAESFRTKALNIDLAENSSNKLSTFLVPEDNDFSFYEKQNNLDSLNILLSLNGYTGGIGGNRGDNITTDKNHSADGFIKKLEIQNQLPLTFTICGEPASRMNCNSVQVTYGYHEDCNNSLCIIISGRTKEINGETVRTVNEKLSEIGYNLDDYTYIYTYDQNR